MDNENIKKLKEDTSQTLAEVIELNNNLEKFLDEKSNEDVEDVDQIDAEDDNEFNDMLKELDEDLNNALLDFASKEEE